MPTEQHDLLMAELSAALHNALTDRPQECGHSSDPMCCPFENFPTLARFFEEAVEASPDQQRHAARAAAKALTAMADHFEGDPIPWRPADIQSVLRQRAADEATLAGLVAALGSTDG